MIDKIKHYKEQYQVADKPKKAKDAPKQKSPGHKENTDGR